MSLIKARVAGVPPVSPDVNTERLTRAFPNGGRYVPRTALHSRPRQNPRRDVNRAQETARRAARVTPC